MRRIIHTIIPRSRPDPHHIYRFVHIYIDSTTPKNGVVFSALYLKTSWRPHDTSWQFVGFLGRRGEDLGELSLGLRRLGVWRLCWGGHRRLHRTWLGVVEIAPGGGEGLGGACVRGGFVAGVGAASGVEGRQAGAGGGG